MEPNMLLRLGAVGVMGLALLAAAFAPPGSKAPEPTRVLPTIAPTDPLAAELTRCRNLGLKAAGDPTCKEAWAQNRARFFSPPKPPMEH